MPGRMRVGVPRETTPGEPRVALMPETVARLGQAGISVLVESGAGAGSFASDEAYRTAGATIADNARALYAGAELVLKVRPPRMDEGLGVHEADLLAEGATLIGFLGASPDPDMLRRLGQRRVTAYAFERLPRVTRAQSMDALSSMSTIAGYRAALIAAAAMKRMIPLMMTAAGTLAPARFFVLGAGVAGLQAIATARRLGGVVEAFDVRPAVREEVQSLGATFVNLELTGDDRASRGGYAKEMTADDQRRERELLAKHVTGADAVISTAAVPGRKAPRLVSEDMVRGMKPGSVIVDLAAEGGGNCELTEPGRDVVRYGVTILGPLNLAGTLPVHASLTYGRNCAAFLKHLVRDGKLAPDFEDEITRESCVLREGQPLTQATVAGA